MSPTDEAAPERPRDRRVFFALWPDGAVRTQIARVTKDVVSRSGGRPIAKDRLHATVAFLGNLTAAGLDAARGVPPIQVGAFELALDTIGVFAKTRVLWVGPRTVPAALLDLERRLWDALEERGFVREPRIYQPHVTLARRARPVEEAVDGVLWPVADLALVESLPDGRNVHYEVLDTWPL